MLLVNFVLMIFWKRDALQREAGRDQVMLAHIQALLPTELSALKTFSKKNFTDTAFHNDKLNSQVFLSLKDTKKYLTPDKVEENNLNNSKLINSLLTSAIAEAKTGREVSRSASSHYDWRPACKYLLVSAQPVLRRGKIIGAIAIVRSLDSISHALWKAEKTVLVYILFNLLCLLTIGFFRIAKLVGRPVERLMRLADQYNDDDPFLFAAESTGSEFSKLSNSLNSMLTKIEHDRHSLRETVAELETANVKLQRQQKKMIRAEKLASVGRMAAGLAHEIGNPLGAVQGYLGILSRSENQSDEHKDFIRRSEQELQRVNNLIRQLLDFSRATKGTPEKFSLHELLRSVVEMIHIQSGFKKIELEIELTAENDIIFADREQLRQVLVNCLLNSADALNTADFPADHKGKIALSTELHKISSSANEDKTTKRLCIRLADNGIGITEEQLSVIFDPFYTTKEPGKGTGLGLSVSRSILENIGGTMEMESGERQGSVMSISLPLTFTDSGDD
ncbi:MAG: sensor histidine kinase [Candidatus Electrothrix sp. AR4]|nr:sensor histidine kinase [Candidatus Electrothrix sp. AR4]